MCFSMMENEIEQTMENDMETGLIPWFMAVSVFGNVTAPFWEPDFCRIQNCPFRFLLWVRVFGFR